MGGGEECLVSESPRSGKGRGAMAGGSEMGGDDGQVEAVAKTPAQQAQERVSHAFYVQVRRVKGLWTAEQQCRGRRGRRGGGSGRVDGDPGCFAPVRQISCSSYAPPLHIDCVLRYVPTPDVRVRLL